MKLLAFIFTLINAFAAPIALAEKAVPEIVQLNLQIQSLDMAKPANFAIELVPSALPAYYDQNIHLLQRTSRIVRGIYGISYIEPDIRKKLKLAFSEIPDIKVLLYSTAPGLKELCLTFEGDLNGMELKTNLQNLKSLDRTFAGIKLPRNSTYCFDVVQELQAHSTVFAVFTGNQARKRVALYVSFL